MSRFLTRTKALPCKYWSKIDLGKLPPKKSADEKVLLAAAMKRPVSFRTGLAERLQMGQSASVSQFARRWQTQPKKTREISALLSRIKT